MSGETHTLSGTYIYHSLDQATTAMVKLLVLLKATGVRLSDINVENERTVLFRKTGNLEFTVASSAEKIANFRRLFNKD